MDVILRATWSGYVVLCSPWLVFAAGYFWLAFRDRNGDCFYVSLLCLSMVVVICGWLHDRADNG
jgi:uncharacterized membrane protein